MSSRCFDVILRTPATSASRRMRCLYWSMMTGRIVFAAALGESGAHPYTCDLRPIGAECSPGGGCLRRSRIRGTSPHIAKTQAYRDGEAADTIWSMRRACALLHLRPADPPGSASIGCHRRQPSRGWPFVARPGSALLETFAAQAVIAIENVRQFRELQTRLEREAATREILSVISQSRDDEQPVFDVILEHAARLCATSYASLHLVDERRENWILTAARSNHHRSFEIGEVFPLPASRTAAATSILEARVVHIEDLADDDLYRQGDPVRVRTVDEEGARTMLVVPLITGGLAIGCITLRRNEVRPFSADQIALVESFRRPGRHRH